MSPVLTPATHRASFAIGDEQAARRVADVLEEAFFEGQAEGIATDQVVENILETVEAPVMAA